MNYYESATKTNSEHLFLYKLCANIAAIAGVIGGFTLLVPYSFGYHKHSLGGIIIIALPLTVILVIGKYRYPRLCSFLLLLKFQLSGIYASWLGFDSALFLSSICSVFFLMGYIESTQRFRIKNELTSFWIGKAGVLQYMTIILIGIALTVLSWVYIPFLLSN